MGCTALPLRGRLKGQRGVNRLCLKQTPSPRLPGLLACGGLAFSSGCFQPLVLGKRVDTNKAPWSTCSEPDISHFPDAGPACVGLRGAGPCLLQRGLERIVQMLTWACAMQASGLFVSETGLGSEGLIFWDGPKRGSVQQVPRGTKVSQRGSGMRDGRLLAATVWSWTSPITVGLHFPIEGLGRGPLHNS